ncbi:MAG: hypothetical protein ACT4OX_03930 [Actinomycetota bacterium]
MEAGSNIVRRALPIDAPLLSAVVLRMRRDAAGRQARWSLGDRGAMELDVHFSPVPGSPAVLGRAWTTTGRLWDPDQLAMATVIVELEARAADECELWLAPADALSPWWQERTEAFDILAKAAVEELGEELLWHASRVDISQSS